MDRSFSLNEAPARTEKPAPTDDSLAAVAELVAELTPIVALRHAAVASHCVRHDISMMHLHVLSTLETGAALSMSRLAVTLDVSLSSATGIVTRLEERGLVERIHDLDDRRLVLVRLTDEGRRVASGMDTAVARKLAAIVAELSPDERANALRAVQDMHAAATRLRARGVLFLPEVPASDPPDRQEDGYGDAPPLATTPASGR
jgi:DNA-binding MarR family transcriptional regulator